MDSSSPENKPTLKIQDIIDHWRNKTDRELQSTRMLFWQYYEQGQQIHGRNKKYKPLQHARQTLNGFGYSDLDICAALWTRGETPKPIKPIANSYRLEYPSVLTNTNGLAPPQQSRPLNDKVATPNLSENKNITKPQATIKAFRNATDSSSIHGYVDVSFAPLLTATHSQQRVIFRNGTLTVKLSRPPACERFDKKAYEQAATEALIAYLDELPTAQ